MRTLRIVLAVAAGVVLLGASLPVPGTPESAGGGVLGGFLVLPAAVLPPLVLLGTLALIRRARRRDERRLI